MGHIFHHLRPELHRRKTSLTPLRVLVCRLGVDDPVVPRVVNVGRDMKVVGEQNILKPPEIAEERRGDEEILGDEELGQMMYWPLRIWVVQEVSDEIRLPQREADRVDEAYSLYVFWALFHDPRSHDRAVRVTEPRTCCEAVAGEDVVDGSQCLFHCRDFGDPFKADVR
jgi:hypothetical protein